VCGKLSQQVKCPSRVGLQRPQRQPKRRNLGRAATVIHYGRQPRDHLRQAHLTMLCCQLLLGQPQQEQ
jgi:hypothetical protein